MFKQAKPIWVKDAKKEYNTLFGFTLNFEGDGDYCLKIAAADCYQAYLNGTFLAAGPARSASGYFRLDEINFSAKNKNNSLIILVAEYNVNSYEYAPNDGFLQAEVINGNAVAAYTDADTEIFDVIGHVQKVPRYSFQRTFSEVWNIDADYVKMLNGERLSKNYSAEVINEKNILHRASGISKFSKINSGIISSGKMQPDATYGKNGNLNNFENARFFIPTENFKTYKKEELTCDLVREICAIKNISFDKNAKDAAIDEGEFRIYDFEVDACGFVNLKIKAEKDSVIYITFDEILVDSDVNFYRLDCLNCIKYTFKAGEYSVLSFEPYVFRYAKIYCNTGSVNVLDFSLKEVANPDVEKVNFKSGNAKIKNIFDAAVNTFKYNAVDIFMDCPSRERAGWLCDGYFTGKTEKVLTGENKVEHDFLENFLLNDCYQYLPEGMVPMCYPAGHPDGVFIPTWAMWFILELDRYNKDSGDNKFIEQAKAKVEGILKYFTKFENELGLLENLESWVFIEWSKAAEFVNGVNYCANMLYSLTLQRAGEMYGEKAYIEKAEKIREIIRQKSFNGKFFTDHAVRNEKGELEYCKETTEVCQYYAFFTQTATPETYPKLWDTLLIEFGPNRKNDNKYPEVYFANAFIGDYLRLSLLFENGLKEQVLNECVDYFSYMADITKTLWEHDSTFASCNHGFASHVVYWLNEYNEAK